MIEYIISAIRVSRSSLLSHTERSRCHIRAQFEVGTYAKRAGGTAKRPVTGSGGAEINAASAAVTDVPLDRGGIGGNLR